MKGKSDGRGKFFGKIYRYQRFNTLTLSALCCDQLHFAPPDSFNDPFDCRPVIKSDSNNQELRETLGLLIQKRVLAEIKDSLRKAKIKGDKAEAYAMSSANKEVSRILENIAYEATNPEYQCGEQDAENLILTTEVRDELMSQYDRGVCCFASTFNNPLLWSHYADHHRGICVGYSVKRHPQPHLHRVVYGGSRVIRTSTIVRAVLKNDQEAKGDLDRDVLLRKAGGWKYEREMRLFGQRGLRDSPLLLSDVTFGLRCPEVLKYVVYSALRSRKNDVNFYEIVSGEEEFRLKRCKIDADDLERSYPMTAISGEEMFDVVLGGVDDVESKR